jgi:hypothetical protein
MPLIPVVLALLSVVMPAAQTPARIIKAPPLALERDGVKVGIRETTLFFPTVWILPTATPTSSVEEAVVVLPSLGNLPSRVARPVAVVAARFSARGHMEADIRTPHKILEHMGSLVSHSPSASGLYTGMAGEGPMSTVEMR